MEVKLGPGEVFVGGVIYALVLEFQAWRGRLRVPREFGELDLFEVLMNFFPVCLNPDSERGVEGFVYVRCGAGGQVVSPVFLHVNVPAQDHLVADATV